MNRDYKVLLCDDNQQWIDSLEDEIKDAVRSSTGLIPRIDSINRIEELDGRDFNQYDLFLFDYHLEDENKKTGADLISSIRTKDIYTVVIFYSSDDTLHQEIAAKKLDGVYVCNRRDDEHLLEKIRVVSNLSVKRLLDPNSLRGLFLTSVAEIESKLDRVLPIIHERMLIASSGSGQQIRNYAQQYVEKVKDTLQKFITSTEKEIAKINEGSLDFKSMVEKRAFLDLAKKARLLYSMVNHGLIKDKFEKVFAAHQMELSDAFVNTFDSEIRLFRNNLAHEPEDHLLDYMREQIALLTAHPSRAMQILEGRSLDDFPDESFKFLHYIVSLENEYNSFMDDLIKTAESIHP